MGGCLFIDEAYALVQGGGDSFSGEAIRMLLTEVENNRTNILVILAGYHDKMDLLFDADPGLARRFGTKLQLHDYTPPKLAEICTAKAKSSFGYGFAEGLQEQLAGHIAREHGHEIAQHNGGLCNTLVERAVGRLSGRYVDACAAARAEGRLEDAARLSEAVRSGAQVLEAADFGIRDPQEVDSAAASASAEHAPGHDGAHERAPVPQHAPSQAAAALPPPPPPPVTTEARMLGALRGMIDDALSEKLSGIPPELLGGGPSNDPAAGAGGGVGVGGGGGGRGRGTRRPPRERRREKQDEPLVLDRPPPKPPVDDPKPESEQEEAEGEDEEEEELEEERIQEAISMAGQCSQGFAWDHRQQISNACGQCGCGTGYEGYQCKGGTHWLCMPCIRSAAGAD
jgi:hypothetical protein